MPPCAVMAVRDRVEMACARSSTAIAVEVAGSCRSPARDASMTMGHVVHGKEFANTLTALWMRRQHTVPVTVSRESLLRIASGAPGSSWNQSSYRDVDPDSNPASPHPVRSNPQLGPPRGFDIHGEPHKRPEGGTDESCLAHGDAPFRARILLVKRNMRGGHPPRSALKMQPDQSTARGAKE